VPFGNLWTGQYVQMDEAQPVRYVCAFCSQPTDDDPRYAQLDLWWPLSGESQSLGAHAACLRAAVQRSIPLAVE